MEFIPETRQSLLLRVRDQNDRQAWDEFVDTYQPVVYHVAVSRGLQDADALDLVQTVFVAIAGASGRWSPKGPEFRFRHWLLRVAKNATMNALLRKPVDQAYAVLGGTGSRAVDWRASDNHKAAPVEPLPYPLIVNGRSKNWLPSDIQNCTTR